MPGREVRQTPDGQRHEDDQGGARDGGANRGADRAGGTHRVVEQRHAAPELGPVEYRVERPAQDREEAHLKDPQHRQQAEQRPRRDGQYPARPRGQSDQERAAEQPLDRDSEERGRGDLRDLPGSDESKEHQRPGQAGEDRADCDVAWPLVVPSCLVVACRLVPSGRAGWGANRQAGDPSRADARCLVFTRRVTPDAHRATGGPRRGRRTGSPAPAPGPEPGDRAEAAEEVRSTLFDTDPTNPEVHLSPVSTASGPEAPRQRAASWCA